MSRVFYLLFALFAYALFFVTFLYMIAFVGDFALVPRTVDRGPPAPAAAALAIDLALIAAFGLQHSVMARAGFKRAWTRIVPEPIERSVYVLVASLMLVLLFACWRPLPQILWQVEQPLLAALLWVLFGAGWLMVLVSSFLISHFELFGVSQVVAHLRGRAALAPRFRQPLLYRMVRHPLYSGFFLGLWAIPRMTLGHLVLAAGLGVYVLVAIRYEERDMVGLFGDEYRDYRRRVGALVPRWPGRAG